MYRVYLAEMLVNWSCQPGRGRSLSLSTNVYLTPHMAFYTERTVSDMMNNACLGLLNFEKGIENPFEVTG